MTLMKKIFLFLFTSLYSLHVLAIVKLPAIFSNNMVLQQKSDVAVWGWAEKGNKVSLYTSWNKKKYTTTSSDNGYWKIMISTPAAGGPYSIKISDGQEIELKEILIGEVWFCSGQSNMEMPVKGFSKQSIDGMDDFLREANNPSIRLFTVRRSASTSTSDSLKGNWTPANSASVSSFSAVGYLFAKLLQEKLNIPVGIISSSVGGTRIEAWIPRENSEGFPSMNTRAKDSNFQAFKNNPSVLFNAMINPVAGFGIKGFLWYQGEANKMNPKEYPALMEAMVLGWRKKWNRGDLPFYYVQIAPKEFNDPLNKSTLVREAQLMAQARIPNSAMAVSIDVGHEQSIHPPDKLTIAKRLIMIAMAKTYNAGNEWSGPVLKEIKIIKDSVQLRFDHMAGGLTDQNKGLRLFEVAGSDKVFHPAEAAITSYGVGLYCREVKDPVAVRYAFRDWVSGDLFNSAGLPASSFRTDNW